MSHCPLCITNQAEGTSAAAETPAGSTDDICPRCGVSITVSQQLLKELSARAAEQLKVPVRLVTAHTLLLDLPVDSLGLVEFVTELERDYSVNLLEQAWSEDVTYGEVVRLVLKARYPDACR